MSDPTQDSEADTVAHPTATATASTIAPETATPTAPPEPSEGHAPVTREDSRSSSPSAEASPPLPAESLASTHAKAMFVMHQAILKKHRIPGLAAAPGTADPSAGTAPAATVTAEDSEGCPQRTESPTSDAPDPLAVWAEGMKSRYPRKPALTITAGTAASSAAPATTSAGAAGDASDDQGLTKFPDLDQENAIPMTPSPTSLGPSGPLSIPTGGGTLSRRDSHRSDSSPGSPTLSRRGSLEVSKADFARATGARGLSLRTESPAVRRALERLSLQPQQDGSGSPTSSRPLSRRQSSLRDSPSPKQPSSRRTSNAASATGSDTAANTAPAPSDRAD